MKKKSIHIIRYRYDNMDMGAFEQDRYTEYDDAIYADCDIELFIDWMREHHTEKLVWNEDETELLVYDEDDNVIGAYDNFRIEIDSNLREKLDCLVLDFESDEYDLFVLAVEKENIMKEYKESALNDTIPKILKMVWNGEKYLEEK